MAGQSVVLLPLFRGGRPIFDMTSPVSGEKCLTTESVPAEYNANKKNRQQPAKCGFYIKHTLAVMAVRKTPAAAFVAASAPNALYQPLPIVGATVIVASVLLRGYAKGLDTTANQTHCQ